MTSLPCDRRPLACRVALGTAAVSLAVVGFPAVASAAPPTTPFVSEIHDDDAGTDTGEFVEVTFPAGEVPTGWRIALHDGGTDGSVAVQYEVDPVVAGEQAGVGVVTYPANGIRNGVDGLALVAPEGTVAEFLSYDGRLTAAVGGLVPGDAGSTDLGVSESGSGPIGESLSRRYDPATGRLVWQRTAAATRGVADEPLTTAPGPGPADPCDTTPTHEIGAVQGTGAATPLAGREVTVRGTVVGDVPGLSGFHLQDVDGDGDAATSDGVFVSSPDATVELGQTVAVTGSAGESGGQTQIGAPTGVGVCAPGTAADLPAPAPLDLPADDAARERLEGVLVEPVDRLTVSDVSDLTGFGELTLSGGGLLVQPTELARPGTPEARGIATANALRSIVLDDAVGARTSVTRRPYLSPTTPVRVGDELGLTAPLVLGEGFGSYRLQPADGTAAGTFAPQDTRPAAPGDVGGDVRVGAFNVLNYFLTRSGPNARGARSEREFGQQAGKIVTAIDALGADVVTLMEIEDTDSTGRDDGNADAALADLVTRLNVAAGHDKWDYVPLPRELYAVDRDVIRNAIIYQVGVVQPVGDPVGLVDEEAFDNAREPQAQTFVEDGDTFTVVANHFKSKNPGDPPPPAGDPNADSGDGQGAWNGDRVRQAASLAGFVAELRAVDPDVLSLGDYNAYTREDPVERLRQAGLTDLGEEFDPGRYSYVFDALSGSLDHALATASLTAKVTDVAHWNVNSVESAAYQYSGDEALYAPHPYRSSDHDPIVVGIDLDERCDGLVPTIRGTSRARSGTR